MSRLEAVLRDLLRQAGERPGRPTREARLKNGLGVSVKVTREQATLCLTRDAATPPGHEEAVTCGHHLGWWGPEIRSGTTQAGLPCLLVSRAVPPAGLPFTPGHALAFLPQKPPVKTLLGLAAGGRWVTFTWNGQQATWRVVGGPETGEGSLGDLRQFLAALNARERAA